MPWPIYLAGLVLTALGFVVVPWVQRLFRKNDPDFRKHAQDLAEPKPQLVQWGPVVGKPAGMVVGNEFINWEVLRHEIKTKVLPKVHDLPPGDAFLVLRDWNGKKDWLVRITDADGREIGKISIGPDPLRVYIFDGLVRVLILNDILNRKVYEIFQRYSDGTYRKIGDTRIKK